MRSQFTPPIDVLLVTPLEEEKKALLAKLPDYQYLNPMDDTIYRYYQCLLPTFFPDGTEEYYRVVIAPSIGMGHVQSADTVSQGIRQWQPRFVILVGIAGGIAKSDVGLGDILIADKIVNYELQKQEAKGNDIRWEVHPVGSRVLASVQNFSDKTWLKKLTVERPQPGEVQRHIGPIASGNKVIDYDKVLEKYKEVWSKLIGVEMEAGGAAVSVFHATEKPDFFMIRAVSDLADGDKNNPQVKEWRPYACEVAAAYTVAFLQSGPFLSVGEGTSGGSDEPNIPATNLRLDEQILLALYRYRRKNPGDFKMSITELQQVVQSEFELLMSKLFSLEEKGWLKYELIQSGQAGLVWLTAQGVSVAKQIS